MNIKDVDLYYTILYYTMHFVNEYQSVRPKNFTPETVRPPVLNVQGPFALIHAYTIAYRVQDNSAPTERANSALVKFGTCQIWHLHFANLAPRICKLGT